MKHPFFIVLLMLGVSIGSYAQDSSDVADYQRSELMPQDGDWGVTVNVAGLLTSIQLFPPQNTMSQNALFARYTKDSRWTYRFGLAPNVYRYGVTTTDSVGKDLVEFDSTISQAMLSFRPGVEYHFEGTKRLDPYLALDAELGVVGGLDIGSVRNTTDTTGTSKVTRTITDDGGFVIGAKLSAGMNYFVAKNVFIGFEYGVGINNVVSGGDRQEVVQIEPVSGTNTTIRNLSAARTSTFTFLVDPMAQLTLGFFFR